MRAVFVVTPMMIIRCQCGIAVPSNRVGSLVPMAHRTQVSPRSTLYILILRVKIQDLRNTNLPTVWGAETTLEGGQGLDGGHTELY